MMTRGPLIVTKSQVAAAQLHIEIAESVGEAVDPAILAIANAKPEVKVNMSKTIRVTKGQINSAQLLVKHAEMWGRPVPAGIRAIANALPNAHPNVDREDTEVTTVKPRLGTYLVLAFIRDVFVALLAILTALHVPGFWAIGAWLLSAYLCLIVITGLGSVARVVNRAARI